MEGAEEGGAEEGSAEEGGAEEVVQIAGNECSLVTSSRSCCTVGVLVVSTWLQENRRAHSVRVSP